MKLRTQAPRWFKEGEPEKEAKCVKFKPDSSYDPWFPNMDDPSGVEDSTEARKICHGTDDGRICPLIDQCLEFALVNNERFGIWGGTTPEERITIRKERRISWQPYHRVGVKNPQQNSVGG